MIIYFEKYKPKAHGVTQQTIKKVVFGLINLNPMKPEPFTQPTGGPAQLNPFFNRNPKLIYFTNLIHYFTTLKLKIKSNSFKNLEVNKENNYYFQFYSSRLLFSPSCISNPSYLNLSPQCLYQKTASISFYIVELEFAWCNCLNYILITC